MFWSTLTKIGLLYQLISESPGLRVKASTSPRNYVVELLIVCDKEFGDLFNQNRDTIFGFWATQIWDTNLRFKTLPSSNVNFRVVDILLLKNPADQEFIEDLKRIQNRPNLIDVLHKFSEWLYEYDHLLTKFDIAILASGNTFGVTERSRVYQSELCVKNVVLQRHHSVAMATYKFPLRDYYNFPENALAMIMGAVVDAKTQTCQNDSFILGKFWPEKRFYFSKCSDESIARHLQLEISSCVLANKAAERDVLANYSQNVPPTLQKQCQILTNNSNARAVEDYNKCVSTKCFVKINGKPRLVTTLIPIDNTPCGPNQFCFRGRCLQRGFILQNVGTSLCLHSSNICSSCDTLILVPCSKNLTPLDRFIVHEIGNQGKFLMTPYSSVDSRENSDKCMLINSSISTIQYTKCAFTEPDNLTWDLLRNSDTTKTFVLFHRYTQTCAMVHSNGSLGESKKCRFDDPRFQWQFKEDFQPYPFHLLETMYAADFAITEKPIKDIEKTILDNKLDEQTNNVNSVSQVFKSVVVTVICSSLLTCCLYIWYRRKAKLSNFSETSNNQIYNPGSFSNEEAEDIFLSD